MPIIRSFLVEGRVKPNASSPRVLRRMSCFLNTVFYDSVCFKGPHGIFIQILVSECDNFEDRDVTIMTSYVT